MGDEEQLDCHQAIVRAVAKIFVALIFFGVVSLFFVMIYVSAVHMQQSWHHYQDGLKRMTVIEHAHAKVRQASAAWHDG